MGYDGLNRLTSSMVGLSPTPLGKTFSYDPRGNLPSKSDIGSYTYPAAGLAAKSLLEPSLRMD